MRRILILLTVLVTALAPVLAGSPPRASAATTVCALYCDTRDPSLARQETFPTPNVLVNNRVVELHVDDVDGMAWASIDNGQLDDSVWIDRSWDAGSTWDGLLGKAWIPSTWTGTRTLMYDMGDPSNHRRAVVRACGDANGVVCTNWVHLPVCAARCDGVGSSGSVGDTSPVPDTTLNGRDIALHVDSGGMAWASISGGAPGDEIWMDRSWDAGASWPDGSGKGRVSVPSGATGTQTVEINIDDPLGRLAGGAVRACGRAVTGQNGSCTAWARADAVPTKAAADALMWSYDPYTAWWPSSWWNSAVALTSMIDYMRSSGDTSQEWIVDRTFQVDKVSFPAGARSSNPIQGDFISQATDDTEWWALAWVDAYDLTGNRTYLNEAVTIMNYVSSLWDTGTCGGGVWWNTQKTYKNSVTNALYVELTAALHNRIPGDTAWLGRATTAWSWFQNSGLINGSGLVNDGLTNTCTNNGQTVWTYNQGLAIGAAHEMYRATGNGGDLSEARYLADSAVHSPTLVTNGLLTESCDALNATCDDNQKQFKGIFMRFLGDLNDDSAVGGAYSGFIQAQTGSLWNADRDSLNRIGERWSGQGSGTNPNVSDWRTQASGLEALDAGS